MERDILADVDHPFIVKLHYGESPTNTDGRFDITSDDLPTGECSHNWTAATFREFLAAAVSLKKTLDRVGFNCGMQRQLNEIEVQVHKSNLFRIF